MYRDAGTIKKDRPCLNCNFCVKDPAPFSGEKGRRDFDRPCQCIKFTNSPYSLYCNQQDNELQYKQQEVQSYERFNSKRSC